MQDKILVAVKKHLQLSFTGVRDSIESAAKLVLVALEAYAVYWVLFEFAWQPVLPVYQWY